MEYRQPGLVYTVYGTIIFCTLILLAKAINVYDKNSLYISGNYVCKEKSSNDLMECTSLLDGSKVKIIYNATNIRQVGP